MAIDQLNVDHLKAVNDDTAVTMLNLMRFRERSLDGNGSGWDAYLRYSAHAIKLIKARGGHGQKAEIGRASCRERV